MRVWLLILLVAACAHSRMPTGIGNTHTVYIQKGLPSDIYREIQLGLDEWTNVGCPMIEVQEDADILIEYDELWPFPAQPDALAITSASMFISINGPAIEGYDITSVVAHELGHTLHLGHSDSHNDLMYPTFHKGEIRHPTPEEALACRLTSP